MRLLHEYRRFGPWLLLFLPIALLACHQHTEQMSTSFVEQGAMRQAGVRQTGDSTWVLYLTDTKDNLSKWPLPYPVYHFECGDVNGDGSMDLAVGVIKTTRFHPVRAKRLFLFKLYKGRYIRPLWLGSRVGHPLESFALAPQPDPASGAVHIRTVEVEANGSYLAAEYKWKDFGLYFIRYLGRELTLAEANQLIRTN